MKKRLIAALLLVLIVTWALHSYAKAKRSAWNVIKNPETVQMLKNFVATKKAQVYADTNGVQPDIHDIFQYAECGDWLALSNLVYDINDRNGWGVYPRHGFRRALRGFLSFAAGKIGWQRENNSLPYPRGAAGTAFREVYNALDGFVTGDEKYSTEFGREIIDSIPAGSIYFGGSDPGWSIVPAICKSYLTGDPFFTLSLNSLGDVTHLDYLHSMYGSIIYLPTEADREKCFKDFTARLDSNKLKPGESSILNINGLFARMIFDQNTNHEFFVEENFPIGWMRPYLEPHGLIFKINRQPLAELSDEIVQRDRDYWRKSLEPKIGGWLTEETPLETIAAFAKRIFLRHDLEGFTGDARFVQNEYSCKMFSKERSSIAGLYAWRASHSTIDSEKRRMTSEADFAFRQAWALCPDAPEAVYRYVNFLMSQNRFPDALLVAETAAQLTQNSGEMTQLITEMKQFQKEKQAKPGN